MARRISTLGAISTGRRSRVTSGSRGSCRFSAPITAIKISSDDCRHAMPSLLTPIETSPALPHTADAVIIGGGIIGVFTAYYLAKRGMKVAVVEKGRVGAEQSSRNWGWCRQQNRDARELPMATKSLYLWRALRRG